MGPIVMRVLGIDSHIAKGLALGASSHGVGTAAAIQIGAIEGSIKRTGNWLDGYHDSGLGSGYSVDLQLFFHINTQNFLLYFSECTTFAPKIVKDYSITL